MATKNSANPSRAEELKLLANEAFKAHKYSQAVDLYTQAIELNEDNAVYWANRAFAHTKLEEYGSAIQDATRAIEIDPKYSKASTGYYRRGAAYLGMGKFKDALKDFQQVKRICPNDPDAAKKLKECEKAVMKLKFEEAISVPESEKHSVADSIDYHTIGTSPGSSYISLKVAAVAVAVAVLAVFMGTQAAIAVATTAIVIVMVVWGTCWKVCYKDCVFSKGPRHNLDVEPQYSGARIEGDSVTLEFVKQMMDDFKKQKCLHKRYAYQIVLQMRDLLRELPSLVDITVPAGKHFTVCGDVHGQFYDLINIFELNGLPSEDNPYLFNGDFVDRGSFSVEVILTLFAFKCMSPSGHMKQIGLLIDTVLDSAQHRHFQAIYLSRGNHESKSMNKIYGFEGEVKSKLSDTFVELFAEVFCCLPLAHVINEKVFVVHGGLFSVDGVKLSDIKAIDRFCEPPEEDLVVRSHEVKDEGYEIEHDGKLITVFSAPNYCDQMGNKGAFIRFEAPDLKPNIVTFSSVPHPDVKPMAYANNFLRMFS
ncbi:serine/threonine-protein phosphatase 5 [Striga asiatica]|uniref:protein-serine/threonine phosphatase n=1 Tax=Striga asiatica TaxID=4170 RepID=A0A5A7RH03_STRAF|nr:serine/threonine-protein phosphatase 5 [Striga asiatica]